MKPEANMKVEQDMPNEKRSDTPPLDLREEFDVLRKQVNELLTELKSIGQAASERVAEKVQSGTSYYQDKAGQKLHEAYEASNDSLHEVTDRVRSSPMTSLIIAFGIGYILSRMLGPDK